MFTAINCLKEMKPFDEKPRKETCSEIVKGFIYSNKHDTYSLMYCKL